MRLLGDKATARATMQRLGLPVIPGSDGIVHTLDDVHAVAQRLGFPVLLKATAGGGGKGMRICRQPHDIDQAFAAAQAEAKQAFGDAGLYLERYLERGRHIEIQFLGDRYGHAVHLGERECSVQRHHQKLIEESPSPALSPAQRV
jgi:acetyl-CoA carboxylase biotin carboxylase subunit